MTDDLRARLLAAFGVTEEQLAALPDAEVDAAARAERRASKAAVLRMLAEREMDYPLG